MRDQTGHKITDRKRGATFYATKKWIANTQKGDRTPARDSLRECGFVDSTRGVTGRSDIGRWDLQRGPARDEPAGLERCSGDFPD